MSKGFASAVGLTAPEFSDKEKAEAKEALHGINRDLFWIGENYEDDESVLRYKALSQYSRSTRAWPIGMVLESTRNAVAGNVTHPAASQQGQPTLESRGQANNDNQVEDLKRQLAEAKRLHKQLAQAIDPNVDDQGDTLALTVEYAKRARQFRQNALDTELQDKLTKATADLTAANAEITRLQALKPQPATPTTDADKKAAVKAALAPLKPHLAELDTFEQAMVKGSKGHVGWGKGPFKEKVVLSADDANVFTASKNALKKAVEDAEQAAK